MSTKEFRCEFVSSSAAGDCCQVMFEEASEGDGVYVLIQGQFEFPNRGKRYVETSDPDLCGHYVIQNAQLTRNRFRFSYGAGPTKHVTVSRLVMNFNRRVTLPTEKENLTMRYTMIATLPMPRHLRKIASSLSAI